MFDVQVRRGREGELPEDVLASIAGYYARVTTAARPMNRLVAAAMLATLAAIVVQLARGGGWVAWASLALVLLAVGIAAGHTVPAAVRLGTRRDPPAEQSRLARSILRDHLVCLAAVATVIVLQLAAS
jgi:hypothetical protein